MGDKRGGGLLVLLACAVLLAACEPSNVGDPAQKCTDLRLMKWRSVDKRGVQSSGLSNGVVCVVEERKLGEHP